VLIYGSVAIVIEDEAEVAVVGAVVEIVVVVVDCEVQLVVVVVDVVVEDIVVVSVVSTDEVNSWQADKTMVTKTIKAVNIVFFICSSGMDAS